MKRRYPPRLAERALRALVGDDKDGASIIGDLYEEYVELADRVGNGRAALWYWSQVLVTGLGYARPGRAVLERRLQDLAFAIRGIRREPGFAAAVITTLALAIGAGTAIFSVVDAVMLRPLPFEEPDQLVRVWAMDERSGEPYVDLLYADIDIFRSGVSSFSDVSGLSVAPRSMLDVRGENPEDVLVARSTANLFTTLGITTELGRAYTEADARSGEQLIVISHGLWERRFASDRDVLGSMVHLDSRGYEIIGVLRKGLEYPADADVWRALTPAAMEDDDREAHLVARLRPDATALTASAEVASVAAGIASDRPETNDGLGAWIQPLRATVVRDVRTAMFALLGAVSLVLLIGCVNTANLLFARSTRRSHEVAIRTALGASRLRIVSLHLTESLLLAALGGVAGLFVGRWALAFILTVSPELPRLSTVALDARVIAIMGLVTALSGALFGVGPALQAANTPPERTLREGGLGSTQGNRRLRVQSALVATEIALSTVLAVLALLLFSTFRTALTYDRGFAFDNLVAVTIEPMHPPEAGDATLAYFGSVLEGVQRIGGVRGAALSSHPILQPRGYRVPVSVEGAPVVTPTPQAYVNTASDDFFAVAEIAILEGGGFSATGGVEGDLELIVNERFADQHLVGPDGRLGTRVGLGWIGEGHVVGTARDVETEIGEPAQPKVYVSMRRLGVPGMSLTIRVISDPSPVIPDIERAITSVDPNVLIEDITVVEQALRTSVAPQRFNMILVLSFATLALTLAAVGIYGVTTFSVATRRSEIGIRRALGASNHRVAADVARRIGVLTVIGIGAGMIGAVSGGRLLTSLLVGVSPTDPYILAAVAALLVATAGAATLVPILRAVRIDPTESLRSS